jgi:hypothetical protein
MMLIVILHQVGTAENHYTVLLRPVACIKQKRQPAWVGVLILVPLLGKMILWKLVIHLGKSRQ